MIKLNIIANFAGRGWSSLMNIIFIPFYIQFMGMESYGLVGFYATLQSVFNLFDFGFSTTLNREFAVLSCKKNFSRQIIDTARTMEATYWGVAGFIFLFFLALTPLLADHWINSESLSSSELLDALRTMGLVVVLRFPLALYSGGLVGLQRQVPLNSIIIAMGSLRNVGTVIALWLVSPTIHIFFTVQAVAALLETVTTMFFMWYFLPGKFLDARFDWDVLMRIKRFASGMTGIGISSMLLTQIDKVILSKILLLETFGYYSLAATVANGLQSCLVHPIMNAVFPRLAQLVSDDSPFRLTDFYHKACRFVSTLIIPAGLVVIFFSTEILEVWTRDRVVANNASQLTKLMVTGMVLNSFMNVPYATQLASGWTSLTFYYNAISILLLIPVLVFMANMYGAGGAAAVWVLLNLSYILFIIQLMHRRLLKGEKGIWYLEDVGLPLAVGLCSAGISKYFLSIKTFSPLIAILISFVFICFMVGLSNRDLRKILSSLIDLTILNVRFKR